MYLTEFTTLGFFKGKNWPQGLLKSDPFMHIQVNSQQLISAIFACFMESNACSGWNFSRRFIIDNNSLLNDRKTVRA